MEKLEQLKLIFREQIEWYKENTAKEKAGDLDSSYVYDMAVEQFNDLSRGDCASILAILAE